MSLCLSEGVFLRETGTCLCVCFVCVREREGGTGREIMCMLMKERWKEGFVWLGELR